MSKDRVILHLHALERDSNQKSNACGKCFALDDWRARHDIHSEQNGYGKCEGLSLSPTLKRLANGEVNALPRLISRVFFAWGNTDMQILSTILGNEAIKVAASVALGDTENA